MAAVTDEDDLRSKISGEVESLFDMGYSADEAVSYYQKHLDALDFENVELPPLVRWVRHNHYGNARSIGNC